MTNNTLEMLADMLQKRQRERDQNDPEYQALREAYQTLWRTFTEEHRHNRRLRREVLRLMDLHDELEEGHNRFHFQAGLQMGLELGHLRVLEDEA